MSKIKQLNENARRVAIQRAVEALKVYQGQRVTVTLIIKGGTVSCTCFGVLTITEGWLSVVRDEGDSWTQSLAFDPRVVTTLDADIGTAGASILVTMPDKER